MSTNFIIFHYEDKQSWIDSVKSYITTIKKEYEDSISISYQPFLEYKYLIDEIVENNTKPDLIILDMYDENDIVVGEEILEQLNCNKIEIPTIIYTIGAGKNTYQVNYSNLRREYNFFYKEIFKSSKNEDLKNVIRDHIETKVSSPIFNLNNIDEDDILLKADIRSIGENNLKKILFKIHKNINSQDFTIKRMSSGYSGAALFKLINDNKTKILKISKDKENLKAEHDKSKKLYKEFPGKFRIDINETSYETEKVYAILIEYVHGATTLFDWLKNKKNQNIIIKYFENLYSEINGLTYFYSSNKNSDKVKFTHIFNIFENNYAFVATAIKELNSIIEKNNFNESDLKNLVLNGIYKNIDKTILVDNIYQKCKLLCHGDFHSNNVIVQGNDPVIIDTGGIKYDYWCIDICRLIVHLFITGYERDTIKYFDISEITNNLNIANKIITMNSIQPDGNNDGYIYAINWLIENVENIYGTLYCKWEFQLGLCKEFLQMSYRTNSIPPNKRAIALLSAHECMIQASDSLRSLLK